MTKLCEGVELYCGDAVAKLRTMPDGCVHCCVTSPPYYGLRDYQTGQWIGGDPDCSHLPADTPTKRGIASSTLGGGKNHTGHKQEGYRSMCLRCGALREDLQIGLEESPDEYVAKLVEVFAEVRRVLHESGTLWLNLGDSFNNFRVGQCGQSVHDHAVHDQPTARRRGYSGLKEKDLLGIPWMVAFALRADGWYLRQWCPWVKRNPMPESVTDRPSTACETMFLLAKSPSYFFDMEAVKRASVDPESYTGRVKRNLDKFGKHDAEGKARTRAGLAKLDGDTYPNRNFRSADLWFESVGALFADGSLLGFDVTTKPYKGSHFAVMPTALVEPCIKAGTSEKGCCPTCLTPWVRVVEKDRKSTRPGTASKVHTPNGSKQDAVGNPTYTGFNARWKETVGNRDPQRHCTTSVTVGWEQSCECPEHSPVPCRVLDPFGGSGTVGAVASRLWRHATMIELNPEYCSLIRERIEAATATGKDSLFAETP